jgi:hypothetical protein
VVEDGYRAVGYHFAHDCHGVEASDFSGR